MEPCEYLSCQIERAIMTQAAVEQTPEDREDPVTTTQGYPDDNPKTVLGTAKPGVSCVPPVAMLILGQAMANGGEKYGPMNWREKNVSSTVYYDAAMRHLMSWFDGEDYAEDSGVHHLGHVMACCAILLDAARSHSLNDNRPSPGPRWYGPTPGFISANTVSPLVSADMGDLEKRVLCETPAEVHGWDHKPTYGTRLPDDGWV